MNERICVKCGKPAQGYKYFCRSCYSAAWAKANGYKSQKNYNKKTGYASLKKWNETHPEDAKKRQLKFSRSVKRKIIMKRWRGNHPERNAFDCALRRASKSKAMPHWVNKNDLEKIYSARPNGMHVDHIIPLRGEIVCGLHVPWNLQYLTAFENGSKKNRFQVD